MFDAIKALLDKYPAKEIFIYDLFVELKLAYTYPIPAEMTQALDKLGYDLKEKRYKFRGGPLVIAVRRRGLPRSKAKTGRVGPAADLEKWLAANTPDDFTIGEIAPKIPLPNDHTTNTMIGIALRDLGYTSRRSRRPGSPRTVTIYTRPKSEH